jgi:prepilin-type N-terminal cleavage/methylation domain-containing protein
MSGGQEQRLPSGSRGFTLTEILVVVALLSILVAIAVPNWATLLPTYALNSAMRQVQSELHKIKSQAISENTSYQLVVSTAPATSYAVQGASVTQVTKPLPDGIEITAAVNVSFTSRGTAQSQTVKLQNKKSACAHVVVSSTGRVRTCKPANCSTTC